MPYGYGNVPGSTITNPLAKINSDGGRIVSDGSGKLTCNTLVANDGSWTIGKEIICRQIRCDNRYYWNIGANGAIQFDDGWIASDGKGNLSAYRFYGDGSGLSDVYACGGYADNAGNCNYAENANSAYSAYYANEANFAYYAGSTSNCDNANYAEYANNAGNADNAHNANYANDANYAYNSYQAYQSDYANYANQADNAYNANYAYQADNANYASNASSLDSWNDCNIYGNCFVNTLQVATGNGLPSYPPNGTIASDGEYLYLYINGWRKLAFAD